MCESDMRERAAAERADPNGPAGVGEGLISMARGRDPLLPQVRNRGVTLPGGDIGLL